MFAKILSTYWWMTLIRGILWVLFGIFVFAEPGISLLTLTLYVGALFLVDGVANMVSAIGGRKEQEHWWLLLLAGLAGVGVGLLTFMNPAITGLALLFYIAIWAIATGLLEIGAAIRLRREIQGEFWLILAGLVSVGFGVLLVARPIQGALAVLWIIGTFAIAFGVILVVLAIRARGFVKRLEGPHGLRHA
jgi:uncharacterized membrane protein HdeD (DUF308 family)